MAWEAVVLAINILLLAAGWLLFQRARGELSARAAETPVLAEIKALQRSVKILLSELESMSERQSIRLEDGCTNASAILLDIETRVRDAQMVLAEYDDRIAVIEPGRSPAAEPPAGPIARSLPNYVDHHIVVQDSRTGPIISQFSGPDIAANSSHAETAVAAESLRTKIFVLADSGLSTAVIAHATRLSEGEVETLLSLRARR